MMWPPLTASPMNWLSRMVISAPPLAAKSVKIWSCHCAIGTQRTWTVASLSLFPSPPSAWQGCQENQIPWRFPPPVPAEAAAVGAGAAVAWGAAVGAGAAVASGAAVGAAAAGAAVG